jgi:hypothetical protein
VVDGRDWVVDGRDWVVDGWGMFGLGRMVNPPLSSHALNTIRIPSKTKFETF